jgi:heme/copper-type cytochrome/quinol oxidase subunit 2
MEMTKTLLFSPRKQRISRALLAFIAAALLIALAPLPVLAAPAARTIRVEAENFAFTPGVVRVNPGDQVTIELVSKDVVHGLSIDGYPVNLTAEPGQTARVTFTASRAGSYKLRCSVACGSLHPFMTGKFEVGPNLLLYRALALGLLIFLYGVWLARVPAAEAL